MAVEEFYGVVVRTTAVQVMIKKIILDDIKNGIPENETKKKVRKLLEKYGATAGFLDKAMRLTILASLAQAFKNWYITTHLAVATRAVKVDGIKISITLGEADYQKFGYPHIEKYRSKVKAAYAQIANGLAKSDGLLEKGRSLRNSAEIEARHQATVSDIDKFKQDGVELVWVSSHINCSERCAPWQGRLYSLNGTSGVIDGKKYVPLETATEIYQTTKTGKVWRNGLFGFNCRHYMTPYSANSQPPMEYNAKQMKIERVKDLEQRKAERAIRREKEKGFLLRSVDYNEAKKKWEIARKMEDDLKEFCRKNKRPYYPQRSQIMTEEIERF